MSDDPQDRKLDAFFKRNSRTVPPAPAGEKSRVFAKILSETGPRVRFRGFRWPAAALGFSSLVIALAVGFSASRWVAPPAETIARGSAPALSREALEAEVFAYYGNGLAEWSPDADDGTSSVADEIFGDL